MANGIDFMAIARGRQLARNENWQDQVRAQQAQRMEMERETWQDQIQERAINREAQAYTAPLITNMQTAASAGVAPVDYLIQQREQVLADPAFQQMSPEVQQRVLNTMGQSVRAQLQDLYNTGDRTGVQRLAQAYGLVSPVTGVDIAIGTGDAQTILDSINQRYGSNFAINADGQTVTVAGQDVPLSRLVYSLAQSGGQAVVGHNLADAQQAQQAADAQRLKTLEQLGLASPSPGTAVGTVGSEQPIQSSVFRTGVSPAPGSIPGIPAANPQAAALQQQLAALGLGGAPGAGGLGSLGSPAQGANPATPSGDLTVPPWLSQYLKQSLSMGVDW